MTNLLPTAPVARVEAGLSDRESHDRTVRLLRGQLEAIAAACERSPSRDRDLEPYVQRARAATRNAVRLELLSSEEAGAIWAAVAVRHPTAVWAQDGPCVAV
jgi:hypothetical protein